MVGSILQFFLFEVFLDVLYFPVWWYTAGLIQCIRYLWNQVRYGVAVLGIGIWIKNFFKPMYGVSTLQERIISVVMRFFVLIGKFIALIAWMLILFLLLVIWLVFLPAVVWLFIIVRFA